VPTADSAQPAAIDDDNRPAAATRGGTSPPGHIGILGGTFNPPHRGHLALARHALDELGLQRLLLVPAGRSPHKPAAEDPGARRRLEMCRLIVADADGLAACPLEVQRAGPSYTVDTLRALRAAHPGARLTFVLGADIARTLPSWREPRELLALADLAVALRAGSAARAVEVELAPLLDGPRPAGSALRTAVQAHAAPDALAVPEALTTPDALAAPQARVHFLNMPAIDVSSSLVRERVRRRQPVTELVGPAVASYIAAHRLYHE
jgi:nicotinate-nucleotide adenylyltransferase